MKPKVARRSPTYSSAMEVAQNVWLILAHFYLFARDSRSPPPEHALLAEQITAPPTNLPL